MANELLKNTLYRVLCATCHA